MNRRHNRVRKDWNEALRAFGRSAHKRRYPLRPFRVKLVQRCDESHRLPMDRLSRSIAKLGVAADSAASALREFKNGRRIDFIDEIGDVPMIAADEETKEFIEFLRENGNVPGVETMRGNIVVMPEEEPKP